MWADIKSISISPKINQSISTSVQNLGKNSLAVQQIATVNQPINISTPPIPASDSTTTPSIFGETSNETFLKLKNFSEKRPNILFICDYVVAEQKIGALIVFEKYFDATHYEIFKDNKFDNDPNFERILFLNVEALKEETKRFLPYVRDILGFELDETTCFIVLDDNIKIDRIYEYFIRAAFVPNDVKEIVHTSIMKSKHQLNTVEVGSTQSVLSLAVSLFSSQQMAWIIALLNPKIPFFGKSAIDLKVFDIQKMVLIPKDNNDLMKIIKDSIYLFGAKICLSSLVSNLGGLQKQTGILSEEIIRVFNDSIDETRGFFSADFFRKKIKETSNAFKLFSDISVSSSETEKQKQLFNASVFVPPVTGEISFNDLKNLSDILNLVRSIDYAITYTRDNLEQSISENKNTEQVSNDGILSDSVLSNILDSKSKQAK